MENTLVNKMSYDRHLMYRVWVTMKDGSTSQAFFTVKEQAQNYIDYMEQDSFLLCAVLNKWSWEVLIEK